MFSSLSEEGAADEEEKWVTHDISEMNCTVEDIFWVSMQRFILKVFETTKSSTYTRTDSTSCTLLEAKWPDGDVRNVDQ